MVLGNSLGNSAKVEETFRKFDKNGDGKISRDEFTDLFKSLDGKNWNPAKIDRLFQAADADRSGFIDVTEFLNWVFAKRAGRAVVEKAEAKAEAKASPKKRPLSRSKTVASGSRVSLAPGEERRDRSASADNAAPAEEEDDDDEESSSSSSSEEEPIDKAKTWPKKSVTIKKVHRVPKARPVITAEAFYESITMEGNAVGAHLTVGELAGLFARCKRGGLNPDFPRLVPQKLGKTPPWDAEDVSAFELAHLFFLLREEPEATDERAMAKLEEVRDKCRELEWDREDSLEQIGLDHEVSIRFNVFKRLVELLSVTTLLDEDHLLSQLNWARTENFELTHTMACDVMTRLFLKAPEKGESVLQIPIKSNDFMRMCHVQSLADNSGQNGIPHAQLSLFFQSTCQALPRLLDERDRARGRAPKAGAEGGGTGGTAAKVREHHHHRSISGRIKLGILLDQLFKAMPNGLYNSPLHMTLSLLEIADAVAIK